MRTLSACAALLLLSACVSANGGLGAQLDNYARRPITELSAVLGEPSAETNVAGQEVYVWGDPRLALLPEMHVPGGEGGAPSECTIRVFVGADQRITSWDILGNEASCQAYRERFSH